MALSKERLDKQLSGVEKPEDFSEDKGLMEKGEGPGGGAEAGHGVDRASAAQSLHSQLSGITPPNAINYSPSAL